jgi:DNA helicase ZGRF1-like protein
MSTQTSQITAPVLEFRCLYTFNITQKKKKWQDGTLKFHTRNKRVMIFDESYNYVGDTHLQNATDVQEGDEFKLDPGCGALIQVEDLLRTTQSDVTALIQKKPTPASNTSTIEIDPAISKILSQRRNLPDGISKKHKSLRSILASQPALGGRDVEEGENLPPTKRIRTCDPVTSTWSVTATTKRPPSKQKATSTGLSVAHLANSRPKSSKGLKRGTKLGEILAGQSTLKVKQIVDLTSSSPLGSSSPIALVGRQIAQPGSRINGAVRTQSAQSAGIVIGPPSSPPVNSSNTIHEVETLLNQDNSRTVLRDLNPPIQSLRDRLPTAKPLKLSKDKSRGKLLCMQAETSRRSTVPNSVGSARINSDEQLDYTVGDQDISFQALEQLDDRSNDTTSANGLQANPQNLVSRQSSRISSPIQRTQSAVVLSQSRDRPQPDLHIIDMAQQVTRNNTQIHRAFTTGFSTRNIQASNADANLVTKQNGNRETHSRALPQSMLFKTAIRGHVPRVAPNAAPSVMPEPPADVGPWSTEALELFDWRPPDWEERRARIPASVGMVD